MFKFFKKKKYTYRNISSQRIKELLIDFKEPKTKDEIEYINKLKKNKKEYHNQDLFSPELLEERQEIVKNWREIELWNGATPINKEEELIIKKHLEYEKESKRKSEDFAKRDKAAQQEILELLKKYNYTDYLPGHKFNNPIFNKRFNSIENEVFELTIKKCVEKYDRVDTCLFADESVPIKQKILKDRYGYDWCPEGTNYCEEFWDEYKAIKKKYHIFSEFLDNRR